MRSLRFLRRIHICRGALGLDDISQTTIASRSPSGARCGMAILGNMCITSFFTGVCIRRPSVIFVAVQMVSFGNLLPAVRWCARPFIDLSHPFFRINLPCAEFQPTPHVLLLSFFCFVTFRYSVIFSESEHRHSHPPSALVRSQPACPQ